MHVHNNSVPAQLSTVCSHIYFFSEQLSTQLTKKHKKVLQAEWRHKTQSDVD